MLFRSVEREGGVTRYLPTGEETSVYDAAQRYGENDIALVILAGKLYGAGSSRDWAAKGTQLLGVKAVIAESFERIHRSNLVGMGVLPLEFIDGQGHSSLGLSGEETFTIKGVADGIEPGQQLEVIASHNGDAKTFTVKCRVDSALEVEYMRHGGILPYVLRSGLE